MKIGKDAPEGVFAITALQGRVVEKEALILRARAELSRLDALYARDDRERSLFESRARAYESQARQLEDLLTGWANSAETG